MAKKALVVEHLGMKFNLGREKAAGASGIIGRLKSRGAGADEFWALQDISFSLDAGDRLGILGLNGAGKSTLLKAIAGVFKPTCGSVKRYGKVVPLLELGAGFEKQYTGRENIYLYGAMLGYSRQYIDKKFDKIVEFSELGRFIDVPIENYSSGMRSRLGFSIATATEPEILILDEVLSVGDVKFRRKSMRKIQSMMGEGTTVLFVSHSLQQVRKICNKAMILEDGKLVAVGDMEEIAARYENMYSVIKDKEERKAKRRARKIERLQKLQNEYERSLELQQEIAARDEMSEKHESTPKEPEVQDGVPSEKQENAPKEPEVQDCVPSEKQENAPKEPVVQDGVPVDKACCQDELQRKKV